MIVAGPRESNSIISGRMEMLLKTEEIFKNNATGFTFKTV